MSRPADDHRALSVAIVGMAGRFPGADSVEELWENLLAGREGVRRFDEEAGAEAAGRGPGWVRAGAVLRDIERFDAELFGYSPREAELMDPQHRLALECAWEALEDAGHGAPGLDGLVGVYAGCGINTYLMHVLSGADGDPSLDGLQLTVGNDKDYLATRISYKLDLKGPSVGIQTACSTSLVAVHLACQALLDHECDLALAGGVSVRAPQPLAYRHQEGGILSPDGRCRAFDAAANGTVFGNGLGFVVLRRLEDALADGDRVVAVVRGSAINNDGAGKVGYTAPSVDGQASVIRRAMAVADVEPATIGYVETHGTGTPMGDPLEVAALARAFGTGLPAASCFLGAIKTNIGHLDAAAGIAGLIKAALVVERGVVPPTLHLERPNPRIELDRTPFRLVRERTQWPANGRPRRAGVSSFGIGGTNAHVVLEEPPPAERAPAARPEQVLVVSARTETALAASRRRLADHLRRHPDTRLADAAFALQVGRRALPWRWAAVASDLEEAVRRLEVAAPGSGVPEETSGEVVFLFPGQGAQHPGMARELYHREAVFRRELDRCLEILRGVVEEDLAELLHPRGDDSEGAARALAETAVTQPALFALEYALARQWMEWGLRPAAMIGHSLGEYVAACLAGVFSLEDCLSLVALRGRLIQDQPRGAMLAVALAEERLRELLPAGVSLSAVNGPELCAVGGPEEAVRDLRGELAARSVHCRPLRTSHAFHSALVEGAVEPFREAVARVALSAPALAFVSTVTGRWIEDRQATDPGYWAGQMREPVRFAEGLRSVLARRPAALLEVGPGRTLGKLARAQGAEVIPSLRDPQEAVGDGRAVAAALGRLWERGVAVEWRRYLGEERHRRVALPGYPFEGRRHWVERGGSAAAGRGREHARLPVEDWLHIRCWRRTPPVRALAPRPGAGGGAYLLLGASPPVAALAGRLRASGREVVEAVRGERFERVDDGRFTVRTRAAEDYRALLDDLAARGAGIAGVVHALGAEERSAGAAEPTLAGEALDGLLLLVQAVGERSDLSGCALHVLVRSLHLVTGRELLRPEGAPAAAAGVVVPLENPALPCRVIDLDWSSEAEAEELGGALFDEITRGGTDELVAYRGGLRWRSAFEAVRLEVPEESEDPLRRGGVYLVTGGLGGLGLELARRLAERYAARLVLVSRSPVDADGDVDLPGAGTAGSGDAAGRPRAAVLRELEAAGAQLLVRPADVARRSDMAAVVAEARSRFGHIDGVFHLAGVPGGGLVQTRSLESVAEVLRPKVDGLRVLESVLRDDPPEWVVLFSSITSVSGALGQADYCAANAFLDAYAEAQWASACRPRALAVSWDAWEHDTWQQRSGQLPPGLQESLRESRARFGIRFDEGFEVIRRALASGLPHLVVSTRDLRATLEAHRITSDTVLSRSRGEAALPTIARPAGEVESVVAAVWGEVLGLDEVGRDRTFVELGGHSLLAIQLVSRLAEELGSEVPLRAVFEHPTVAELAAFLAGEGDGDGRAEPRGVDRLLEEIESLSEEEVERRLAELSGAEAPPLNEVAPPGGES